MSPEREPHAYYNSEVGDYLRRLLGSRAKVREAHPIALSSDSEPIPDLAIVRPLGRAYLEHHPYPSEIFWLIEFSYTTLAKDLNVKKRAYAQAGVLEYWVINLKDSQLNVFKDVKDGAYTTTDLLTNGFVSPHSFNDLKLDVRKLLAP